VLNGGLHTLDEALQQSSGLDGVMLGRAVYQHPYLLTEVDSRCFGEARPQPTRAEVVARMQPYLEREYRGGTAPRHIVRHMLGLWQGRRNARRWRQLLSDALYLERHGAAVLVHALASVGELETDARAAA
jgi:tRNA-dihydrouridine synthase A